MIVSHKHRFIFLKTNKTAGTSVEIALSKFCGPDDIITAISVEDERTRRELGYRGQQNHTLSFPRHLFSSWKGWLLAGGHLYNHMSAREARSVLGKQIWDSYYKFCIERNPWDRVVSLYYWRCQQEPRPSIAEFLDSGVPKALKRNGYGVYTINDQIA
ncbi:MAG: sulfotransferase family 2 domain-containing protein, partial [Chloroflexi bacterium]|nr:sulfotransferase family 2 domain-containing protein [Chloroflexota bacterium]